MLEVLREHGFACGGKRKREHGKVIVFANTKKGCDTLAKYIQQNGDPHTDCIHGNRPQVEREGALKPNPNPNPNPNWRWSEKGL